MPIQFNCPSCFSPIKVSEQNAGKKVACPACKAPARVPGGSSPAPVAAPRSAPRAGSSKPGKKRQWAEGGNGLLIGLLAVGGVVVVAGVGIGAFLLGRGGDGDGAAAAVPATPPATAAAPDPTASTPTSPAASAQASTLLAAAPAADSAAASSIPSAPAVSSALATDPVPAGTTSATVDEAATAPSIDPSLVSIDGKGRRLPPLPPVPDADLTLPDLIELVEKSVVRLHVTGRFGRSTGSGFVIDREGTIVTNYHVIEGAHKAEAEFNTGEKVPVLGYWALDHERDLAVLHIAGYVSMMHPLHIAPSVPRKGEQVAAFGAPLGLSFTATEGIISALRTGSELEHAAGSLLQTTAPISPGNSGGPLVNLRGEVVGINTFQSSEGQNLNFAVSCLDIQDLVAKKAKTEGEISAENIPVKLSGGFGGAQNLSGTERGNQMLSQIKDAVVMIAPLTLDRTGRFADYLEKTAQTAIIKRAQWEEVKYRNDIQGNTAIVFAVMYYQVGEQTTDRNLVSELVIHLQVIARDVDKDGVETIAVVYDDRDAVGTASVETLLSGRVSRTMEDGVKKFFGKFLTTHRQAKAANKE